MNGHDIYEEWTTENSSILIHLLKKLHRDGVCLWSGLPLGLDGWINGGRGAKEQTNDDDFSGERNEKGG